jgi:hypothetical protein
VTRVRRQRLVLVNSTVCCPSHLLMGGRWGRLRPSGIGPGRPPPPRQGPGGRRSDPAARAVPWVGRSGVTYLPGARKGARPPNPRRGRIAGRLPRLPGLAGRGGRRSRDHPEVQALPGKGPADGPTTYLGRPLRAGSAAGWGARHLFAFAVPRTLPPPCCAGRGCGAGCLSCLCLARPCAARGSGAGRGAGSSRRPQRVPPFMPVHEDGRTPVAWQLAGAPS